MSSISISGTSLFQYLQSVSAAGSSQPTVATTSTDTTQDPSQSVQGAGQHHHHHGGGGMFKKVEDAVTSALQSAQADPSADPNKVIEDAIAKVLKGGATDSTSSATSTTSAVQPTASDPDGDGDTGASGANGVSSSVGSGRQAFLQMLQSMGVDPQQFHKDFLAAIQDAQGGTVNTGTAFQSFPPGSTVDTTA